GTDASHYRQTNQDALNNFLKKLQNSLGRFEIRKPEKSKLIIPRIITDFYKHYFNISKFSWKDSRIPTNVKNFSKDFLVAGLASFIIDEGHIGDFVEIYSKNYNLLHDILEIA
ncbi:MAG: hypothetical protein QXM38_03330, partial [Candidatus Aenigmatarchaeota archaeon]